MPSQADALQKAVSYYAHMDCCEFNAQELATVAYKLLVAGTEEQQIKEKTLDIMMRCGMYEESSKWESEVGLPAKSGVSGVVWAVIPGVGGVCAH